MSWVNALGYIASASVLATFCMTTMVPLRIVAIASNVLFAAFGALAHVYPVLVLHTVLLPVNVARLMQVLIPVSAGTRMDTRADEFQHSEECGGPVTRLSVTDDLSLAVFVFVALAAAWMFAGWMLAGLL